MGNPQYNDTPAKYADTIKSEVYIPTTSPPYENPLDLRFPLHWAAGDGGHYILDSESPEEKALKLAAEELSPFSKWDLKADTMVSPVLKLVQMASKPQYPALSPPYFEVGLREAIVPEGLHETVVRAIAKHLGHFKYRPIIRYRVYDDPDSFFLF